MPKLKGIEIFAGRLDEAEIAEILPNYRLVVDATHPYAEEITQNIKNACLSVGVKYIRLLRDISDCFRGKSFSFFSSVDEAVEFLRNENGNIFVSTGSKEIEKYTKLDNWQNRVFGRCLDTEEAVEKCKSIGFKTENFVFGVGPFSYSDNEGVFKKFNIDFLVTKNSGKKGGFDDKVRAAENMGIKIVVIKPPLCENGLSIDEVKAEIKSEYNIGAKFPLFIDLKDKKIVVVGCGSIGQRRINTLVDFNAKVTVVSEDMRGFKPTKGVTVLERKFEENDLCGAFMAVAATNSREINHWIYEICSEKNIFVSVADSKEESSFFFPAICKNDVLTVGVTSDGSSHGAVKKTAEKIREVILTDE